MHACANATRLVPGWCIPALATLVTSLAGAASGGTPTALEWHALAQKLQVEGKGWSETKHPFDRLPAAAENVVRAPVWNLGQHSAGLYYDFVTGAPIVTARWKLRSDRIAMPHMPATGVSGLDLYVRDEGAWRWIGAGRPGESITNEQVLVRGLSRARREFRLYLPLYNGVDSVELGVPIGACIEAAPNHFPRRKPIVFYGTSITQGGCASRPGMAYPSIIGRRLGWPTLNLGFSGNGKTEPEMAALLAELDPAVFVMDSLPNLFVAEAAERLEPFVRVLRARHPLTPIVLVEDVNAPITILDSRRAKVAEMNAWLRQLYDRMRAAGDARVYYVPAFALLGGDGEDTVDGLHPTDLGFARIAEGMTPFLREALRDAGETIADEEGFVSLFDGQTLSGWTRHEGMPPLHRAGKWWVEDGALLGTQDPPGKGGLLWLDRAFSDFILKLQVRLTYPMDSGVFLRVGPDGRSHQVNLDYRPGSDVGAVFIPFVGHGKVCRAPEGARLVRPGDWNDLEIRIEGEPARIRVWLNQRLLTDFQHTGKTTFGVPTAGGIALQVHPNVEGLTVWQAGHVIGFRHIRLKELSSSPGDGSPPIRSRAPAFP
jgi:lysophospholipase L1-like esterase